MHKYKTLFQRHNCSQFRCVSMRFFLFFLLQYPLMLLSYLDTYVHGILQKVIIPLYMYIYVFMLMCAHRSVIVWHIANVQLPCHKMLMELTAGGRNYLSDFSTALAVATAALAASQLPCFAVHSSMTHSLNSLFFCLASVILNRQRLKANN